jgi:titin
VTETEKEGKTWNVTIIWIAPDSDGGAPITNYVIEFRKVGDKQWKRANKDDIVTDLTFTLPGVDEDVDYEFRVAAENKAGQGPYSPPSKSRKFSKSWL